ncbi:hypothetical protein K445DRAFT_301214 [Daldinia sp. EC12]|nr:hypothetical protein F4774DRAFT_399587 [Daldinia eschscholtzii]OTB15195.1 hypothetical protein K445DRAFT_301214 [Daldinia sp. EC12]
MSASSTTLVITTAANDPSFTRRQVTLTQTITYPDATSTALVTLDRGAPPTDSPAPTWSAGAASSDGLGQQQIGIIVGCCIGAAVLGIVLWCCCTNRCGCKPYSVYNEGDHDVIYFSDDMEEIARPERSYWPRFPRSISPPVVPTYVATDTGPQWTAYEASGRYYPNYYGS